MKRTPLIRKTPMKPGASTLKRSAMSPGRKELHRSALKAGTKRLRAYRYRKASSGDIFRSPEYLAAVRTLNCVCCGCDKSFTEAAHSNQLRFGKGRGIKASDATAMALCKTVPGIVGCHAAHDQSGELAKADWWAFEYKHICLTVMTLFRAGKLTGSDMAMLAVIPTVLDDIERHAVLLVSLIESGQLQIKNN